MSCGREVGLFLDDDSFVIAECTEEPLHRWQHHDGAYGLRWDAGAGTDVTGRRHLIDLSDVPVEQQAVAWTARRYAS